MLGSSLDYEQTLAGVARLAVPRVADWCAVDIFVDGKLERLALEHADPLKLALARELEQPLLSAVAAATRTAEPVLVTDVDEDALAAFRFDDSQLEIAHVRADRARRNSETAIIESWHRVRSSIARARASRAAEVASERAAEVARARYEAGTGTQLEVSQSERDLFAAQVARIQAHADLRVARLALRLRSGRGRP